VLAPGKRAMHTLNTYLVFRDGRPYLVGNTPGADFQVQTNLQVITGILDYGLDPQAAIDAARWGDQPGGLLVEEEMPADTQRELARRGHAVRPVPRVSAPMGRAQAIVIDPASGAMIAGSDARGEGAAAGW
jgi:gamma-glutamyltranspeptidase/glutathione hydrolase